MWNGCCMTNPETNARLQWTLGDLLAKALRTAGISNGEMAEHLGVSRNTIGNYIADRTPISDGYVRLWSQATEIPYWELKTGLVVDFPNPPDGGLTGKLRTDNSRPRGELIPIETLADRLGQRAA